VILMGVGALLILLVLGQHLLTEYSRLVRLSDRMGSLALPPAGGANRVGGTMQRR
jgi:hypothetical protein